MSRRRAAGGGGETPLFVGRTVAALARSARIASTVVDEVTYLGAHLVPSEYEDRAEAYVDLVTGPMLEACAPHARWVDVFCEPASPHAFDGTDRGLDPLRDRLPHRAAGDREVHADVRHAVDDGHDGVGEDAAQQVEQRQRDQADDDQ